MGEQNAVVDKTGKHLGKISYNLKEKRFLLVPMNSLAKKQYHAFPDNKCLTKLMSHNEKDQKLKMRSRSS